MPMIDPIDPAHFSMDLLHEAAQFAHDDPTRLTDLHVRHYAVYDPAGAQALLTKRAAALDAAERARLVAAARTREVAVPQTAVADAWPTEAEGLDAWMKRCPRVPTPLGVFKPYMDNLKTFLHDMNERNKERNAKIAALEARVAAFGPDLADAQARAVAAEARVGQLEVRCHELGDRVLQLEATLAARTPTP
jgi:hypothetical protein